VKPAQQEPKIDIYRSFEQWKRGNVLEHGVPRTEHYSEAQLDLVEMGWNYGYDAGRAVEQALDRMAENARELGLDYEPAQKPVTPCTHPSLGFSSLREDGAASRWSCVMCGTEFVPKATQRWTEFNETTKRNIEHAEWYLSTHPQSAQQEPVAKPKLIGWRTSDYLMETSDVDKAKNWEVHYEMLPIFEGDPNTKLAAPQPAQQEYASFAEWAHDYVQDNLHKLKPAQQLVDCHATGVCVQSGLRAEQPAQQEPVAWMNPNGGMLTANYINNFASGLDKEIHNIPLYTSPQPAQQEPVACKTLCELCVKRGYIFCANSAQTTLIPSPPAQRTWQGLTDEEIEKLTVELRDIPVTLAFAIEAKLKEKNT
jgi:hypothetical protein